VAMLRRMSRFELADRRRLHVRSAVPSDARALRSLLDTIGAEPEVVILHLPGSCTTRSLRGQIAQAAAEPDALMLSAFLDGVLVGHLALSADPRPASHHVCRVGLAVRSDDRGAGVGSALLDVALPWAARHGMTKAATSVLAHNARALRFFVAHGFRREGLRVDQFVRDGRRFDEVLMARPLSSGVDSDG